MEEKQKLGRKAAWAAREIFAIRAELTRRERIAHQLAIRQLTSWCAAKKSAAEPGKGVGS